METEFSKGFLEGYERCEEDYRDLIETLSGYLQLKSTDGRQPIRNDMRKRLTLLMNQHIS